MAYREGKFSGQREMDEKGLKFLGLFLFTDPVRPSAKEAIEICQREGIEIKMLTGDHPLTAHAVAEKTGIVHEHEFLFTGQCLSLMSLEEKEQAYQRGAIFSRVRPEQKYEMVEALKKMGKVVAMTGDGINDAPALKLADVGISMGLDATDVARSTAQIILVKNDFRGLVEAVFEGRRIFSNLRKSFSYLVAFHVPVVLLALIPPLFNWGDLLLPIHIIFLELLVHPISAFVFESLPLPPGRVEKSLLPFNRLISALFSGSVLSVLALIIFWKLHSIKGEDVARTYALAAVYLGNMYFVLQSCDFKLSRRLLMTEALLIFFALFVVFVPLASNILYLKL
jgi:Ca2+-transporting ATPase